MKEDLIRRSDAVKAVLGLTMYQERVPIDSVIVNINKAPTIEPKRGKWIQSHSFGYANCSVCGVFWDWGHIKNCNMDFCPNCGASMREREGE